MSSANGHLSSLSTDEMRAAVRSVLREVLPAVLPGLLPEGAASAGAAEVVSLADDADLDRFVRRVAALCEDPAQRAAIAGGRQRFRLAGPAARPSTDKGSPASGVTRVDRGAVTERTVAKAAADGARLVLGPRAVMTPLARDKARVLGVEIEKER
jgi:hypothetical protein